MSFYDDDIDALFLDFGKTITFGAYSTDGIIDSAEEVGLEQDGRAGVIKGAQVVTFKAGDLVGLVVGSTIVVDGVTKTVRQRLNIDDGKLTKILVSN